MKRRNSKFSSNLLACLLACMIWCSVAAAQAPANVSTPASVVPRLVQFSGTLKTGAAPTPNTVTGVTFALYKDEEGGAPLWLETQNIQSDSAGRYKVMLGAASAEGLPADLFVSGEARWLGVQAAGEPEQPRVLLVSVPYALKAGDAATVGGLPPSAFMLATPVASGRSLATDAASSGTAASATPAVTSNVTTSGGAVNAIPLFTTGTNIQNSLLTQTGTTAVNVAGKLTLPASGTATATAGNISRPEDFVTSVFNSTSKAAVAQTFQLQAEPAGNNTAAPSGNLSLLFGSGTAAPTETGFKINNKGILTFAAGQTFPGTGKGTITGVTAGTGLTGGGTTGAVTLKLNTATIPQLGTANNFTAPQDFKANVGVGATPSGNGYTPLTVGGTTNFGTWLALANTSAGGHTWNIISAGSGNAEGAGNLGITDLTGKSTIWLEGNTKTANLTATGTVGAAAVVVTSTAGAAIIDADGFGANAGGPTPGLRFGGGTSGEGIASNRTIGLTKFGMDFYTNFTARMSILQSGQVAVGTASPGAQLGVVAPSNAYPAIYTQGGDAPGGSGQTGGDGVMGYGGNGDGLGGNGGSFFGGGSNSGQLDGGDGIFATAAVPDGDLGYPYAGEFDGNVLVFGNLAKLAGSFKIDHPLDPANKYLYHSFVESPDMMNIYNGVAILDASGGAVIQMPDWFGSLNRDFRYQLTCIGGFAPVYIAEELTNNQFKIGGGRDGMKISWQITGVRQDAWANAHRIPVEEMKNDRERGYYLAPELFGAPREKSIAWARHPEMMRRAKELRQKRGTAATPMRFAATSTQPAQGTAR
jgi:trimeric autotransporter adhesin